MSEIVVECPIWKAILADERLARARRKLSFHEIRLIIQHARTPKQDTDDAVVERMARAIEGPHLPVPTGSQYSLEHLRDIRWKRLSEQEQGERLSQARAALTALTKEDAVDG